MPKKHLWAAICLCTVFLLNAVVARGQAGVRVLESRCEAAFSVKMAFSLVAEADETIESVTLYYRRQSERVTNRAVPDFTPGLRIEAVYEQDLEPGDIPPGTAMEYYWRLGLADGSQVDTETATFVYDDDRFAWERLEAGNVSILYYGADTDASLPQELADAGQRALARLQSEAGVTLEKPVRVYVYQSASDMGNALSRRSEGYDERVLTLGVAVGDDTLLLLGSHDDVRQTLAHELSHIVIGLATRNPYAPPPRWLDEGLAMHAEGTLPTDNERALRHAIRRDSLISVRSLSGYTGDAAQVDLYYGEAYSLVDFMLTTFGRDKMSELLHVFKVGTSQEDALQQVYGLTIDELDARWRESLGLSPRATLAPPTPAAAREARTRSPWALCPGTGFAGVLGMAAVYGGRRVRKS